MGPRLKEGAIAPAMQTWEGCQSSPSNRGFAGLPQGINCPPLTSMIWPVMYPESVADARNR